MRLAAIDLGTNTVRLLVADVLGPGTWQAVDTAQCVTRLGDGLAATGRLDDRAMERTAHAVAEYVARAARLRAGHTMIIGTSAMRDADNGPVFAARLLARTGHRVRIVPGEDEARLTLLGVRHGLPALAGSIVVFDIGGGSTELIRARDGDVQAAVSLRLGVVPLAERDGAGPDAVPSVAARLARELPAAIRTGVVDHLVGTAGTVTTLAALDLGLDAYDPARIHAHILTRAAIERQRARLARLSVDAIARLPCLEAGRADVIRPGIAITRAVMDVLGMDTLVVSETGLREGVVVEALGSG